MFHWQTYKKKETAHSDFSFSEQAAVAAMTVRVVIAIVLSTLYLPNVVGLDLLRNKVWRMDGAFQQPGGVSQKPVNITINGLGRKLLLPGDRLDKGVTIPQIDYRGDALGFDNLFNMRFKLSPRAAADVFIRLYGKLPVVYNNFYEEGDYIAIGVSAGNLTAKTCLAGYCFATASAPANRGVLDTILQIDKGSFTVSGIDAYLPFSTILNEGVLYFGYEVPWKGVLQISELTADGPVHLVPGFSPNRVIRSPTISPTWGSKVLVGAGVATIPLVTDPKYQTAVVTHFREITAQTAMQFDFIHPRRRIYTYGDADAIAEFARLNGLRLHCGTLLWGARLPRWAFALKPVDVAKAFKNHVISVVSHFKGRCHSWDVVRDITIDATGPESAALGSAPNLTPGFTSRSLSLESQYIPSLFRWARQADPNATLYLAESAAETNAGRAQALLDLTKQWKWAGVPIDGISFSFHKQSSTLTQHNISTLFARANMNYLSVRVGELYGNPISPASMTSSYYSRVLKACSMASNCKGVSMWGVTDEYSNVGNTMLLNQMNAWKPAFSEILPPVGTGGGGPRLPRIAVNVSLSLS